MIVEKNFWWNMENDFLMEYSEKFIGIPKIYYLNRDEHTERKKYTENNFKKYNLQNYERISTSKYSELNYEEWKDLVVDIENYKLNKTTAGYSITVIEFLKNWLETTDESSLILMRDNVDFELCKYWPFTWNELMGKIPYDWDCIQLGFENPYFIPFYLHPVMPAHTFGPSLINRFYAKKLVRLHYKNEKYKLCNYIANMSLGGHSGTVDYFIGQNGKTYCLPLLTTNPEFLNKKSGKYKISLACRNTYYYWWQYGRSIFTLEEFFTYGKPNDLLMVKKIKDYIKIDTSSLDVVIGTEEKYRKYDIT